ncbi:MAG TPA: RluA family pseudouridine synthase [Kofleriaceae bacterium]|nr:RluA family pseudouridine synthase [Kofleriaceae bacterium]
MTEAEGDADDELHELVVDAAHAGGRLDAVVAAAIAELSRTQVQRLIETGHVAWRGAVTTKANTRVDAGDAIEVRVPPPEPIEVAPENIPLAVLFEDAELIVIDKPAGLVVHPAVGHASGTLVNALLYHCKDLSGIGGVARPGIVHRLDKDTSGVMVATKTDRAHAALADAFARKGEGAIERAYVAIAAVAPPAARGTLRTLYARHPVDRKRFSSKVTTGKSAVTHYEVIERLREGALVRFTLETGRTHQIRVHAADHGFALLGDAVYGKRSPLIARQALHAQLLAFDHPVTGEHLRFEAPPPPDFAAALAALR